MANDTRKQLRRATIVFWVLLFYIIAALFWWLLSLEQQNREIHDLKQQQITAAPQTEIYQKEWNQIEKARKRNSTKYISEGIAFFLLIFFGAVYIYRLVRRQFQLQLQQQNFVMAVTHELKTPISVARLNLETLQKYQLDEERQKKLLSMTLHETMRLDSLINNILISSQLDGNAYTRSLEELDLSSLVKDITEQFRHRYHDRVVNTNIEEEIDFEGDPLLLKMLLSNLLENANKYSPRHAAIDCLLFKKENRIYLQVKDQGEGIADEEKKLVFEKFYRVGNEQTRKTQGTGLGLYICKKIAQEHGGTITLTDNQPAGSIFTVSFQDK